MITALFLAGAILTEVASTLSLRASDGFAKRAWIAPVVVGYVASFAFLFLALDRGLAVGVAYGIWSAVGVALTAIAGRVLWRDPLTPLMGVGIVLVMGGVLLVEAGAHA